MWPVYRRYHLLIVGQRDDAEEPALSPRRSSMCLSHYLPSSRPQLVSAADARRIGVLIATDQRDVAIMQAESAEALFLAKPPFADIPEAPFRIIVSFGSHVLVCRPNFMARHAYLLAKTLAEHAEGLPAPAVVPGGVVPAHRGSHAFFAGEEIPNEDHDGRLVCSSHAASLNLPCDRAHDALMVTAYDLHARARLKQQPCHIGGTA